MCPYYNPNNVDEDCDIDGACGFTNSLEYRICRSYQKRMISDLDDRVTALERDIKLEKAACPQRTVLESVDSYCKAANCTKKCTTECTLFSFKQWIMVQGIIV
jgi:hypothetical protein